MGQVRAIDSDSLRSFTLCSAEMAEVVAVGNLNATNSGADGSATCALGFIDSGLGGILSRRAL